MNHKNLRKIIRNIIKESDYKKKLEIYHAMGKYSDDLEKSGIDKRSVELDDDLDLKNSRRLAKIIWNKYADHKFFNNEVVGYHSLGYSDNIENYKKYFQKGSNKHEMSCYGILRDDVQGFENSIIRKITNARWIEDNQIGIVFKIKGRVTWAGDFDAYTEMISHVKPEQFAKHKSSGIPKRPGSMKNMGYFESDNIVLDGEDFEMNVSRHKSYLDEIVIDNWKIEKVYIILPALYNDLIRIYDRANLTDISSIFHAYKPVSLKAKHERLKKNAKLFNSIKELMSIAANKNIELDIITDTFGKVDIFSIIKLFREINRKLISETITHDDFEDVEQTAYLAHFRQTRRDGTPYINHPFAVKEITKLYYPNNFAAQLLALLHDSLEDGPKQGHITEKELRQFIRGSIRDPRDLDLIEKGLDLLTHDKSTHPIYEKYLERVFSNRLAAIVKVSDLIHNLSNNPSKRQILKYKKALTNVPIPGYISPLHRKHLLELIK